MKQCTILLIIILCFSVFINAGTSNFADFTGRAISLKVLQQKLKALHGTNSRPTNLFYLCGINQIMGYVLDEANRDIILIGKVDRKMPRLYLDDFVVALRNAWQKYTELKGNTRYYSNPGCSIAPDPKVYKKLNQVWNRTDDTEDAVRQWEKICHSPQQVRVFGIPFNTHFARVMVKADYDMKRLVDGSDELSIFAFNSLMGMEFEREKVRIRKGESRAAPINNLNRFWFSPGEYFFLEDDNMVMIERCAVKLLTEEEHMNEQGKIVGAGHANPAAKQFSEDFTGFYDDIATERPIFRELENLFRFVALAKVLKLKSPHLKIGLNLDYLLEQYQVSTEKVKDHLPGRYHVRKYEGRTRYDGGNQTFKLWMPSCGGVEINHRVEPKSLKHAPYHEKCFLKKMSENTIEERKTAQQMFWDIGTSADNKYYATVLLDSYGAIFQGHIAMVLYSPQEGNYYCSMSKNGNDDKLVNRLKTKQEFKKRVKRYNWGYKIEITREKFMAMKREAERLVQKDYDRDKNNCAHFVRGVLQSGQLVAGRRLKKPNEYICEVLKNNEGTVFWNK